MVSNQLQVHNGNICASSNPQGNVGLL